MESKEIEMQERILEKARDLFFFFGIKSITMDDISKHLGISKKTLYTHYRDKGELVNLVMGNLLAQHVEEMCKIKAHAKNAVDEVIQHATILYTVFKDLKPSVFFEVEKYFPEVSEKFLGHRYNCVLALIKENLERGIGEKLYRPDLEIAFTAQLRLNQLISAFEEKTFESVTYSTASLLDKLTAFYLYAICTDEGKNLITTINNQKTDNK